MTSRRSTLLFSLLFFPAGIAAVFACAWFDESDLYYSFFSPETSRAEEYTPFFRSFHLLYTAYTKDDNVNDFKNVNVDEWSAQLGPDISREAIASWLYTARPGEIDTALMAAKGALPRVSMSEHGRQVLELPDADARISFLTYLSYAKRCEPYVTYISAWTWDSSLIKNDPRKNTAALDSLLREGIAKRSRAENSFLRERYHFQLVRLFFHAGRYDECRNYFADNMQEMSEHRSMFYRSMGYAAGALHRMRRHAEANYLYSILYDRCSIMKTDAFIGFHPQNEKDWRNCLAMARTPRERAVLWHMLGTVDDPLRGMREIYALDPGSDLLDLLLVRSVNIAEGSFMPDRTSIEGDSHTGFALKHGSVDARLLGFIRAGVRRGGTHAPGLWNLAAGYLLVAAGLYDESAGYLARARELAKHDRLVQEQAQLIDIVRMVETAGAPDPPFEARMLDAFHWLSDTTRARELRNASAEDWSKKRLAEKYLAAGDIVKAQLLDPTSDQRFYADAGKQQRMLAFMDAPNKSRFDRHVLTLYPYTRSDIIELQAVTHLYRNELAAAVSRFQDDPGAGAMVLAGDPFLIHINDCHDCDHAAPQARKYTKLDFALRLLSLTRQLDSGGRISANTCFELANGYYNMTFYGNARYVYRTKIFDAGFAEISHGAGEGATDATTDCSRAERLYVKAATLTRDREFQARCIFMAAKCEQNRFFLGKPENYPGDFRAGKYFAGLRKSYADTRYYKDILHECGYFRTYAAASVRKRPR